jgi:hypothetical protein
LARCSFLCLEGVRGGDFVVLSGRVLIAGIAVVLGVAALSATMLPGTAPAQIGGREARFAGLSAGARAVRVRGSGAAETARGRSNRERAEEDTEASLAKLRLPPGAHAGGFGCDTSYGRGTADVVGSRGKWSIEEEVGAVLAFLEAHPPRGSFIQAIHTRIGRESTSSMVELEWPAVSGVLTERWLIIEIGHYGASENPTEVCASAEDVWVDPLAPAYDVPASARVLEVSIPGEGQPAHTVYVTSAAKVRAVRAMIDRMSVSYNPEGRKCKGRLGNNAERATFTFRATAGGRVLAVAGVTNHVEVEGGACEAMRLRVPTGGPTVELEDGPFIREVQKLLGVQIYAPPEPRRAPTTRGPAPEALSATLVVHVYEEGPLPPPVRKPEESMPLRIARLGGAGEILASTETSEHTVHVVPGRYEVAASGGGAPQKVILGPDQELEVTIAIELE